MLTTRLLPREEWDRLRCTELASVTELAATRGCEVYVFVVEDTAGEIVGCWSLFQVWHAEAVWIAPEHRKKSGVARQLLSYAAQLAHALGITHAMTASRSDDVTRLLKRLHAQPLEGAHYLVPLIRQVEDVCPQPLRSH